MSEQAKEERARFQAWVQDRGCDTDGAWSAWQAAKSEVASALSLARSALQEREQRIRVLEEALEWMVETFGDRNRPPKVIEAAVAIHKARSVLNKGNGNG